MNLHVRRASLRLTLLPFLAALGLVFLAACTGEEEEFATDLPDDAYPLEDMLLDLEDLPLAMENANTNTFDNGEWAQLFDVENLRGKVNQLEARGRILGAVREFSWEEPFTHLGGPALITIQSTLYADVESAEDSMSLYCGSLINERTVTDYTDFWVADIGDGAEGFIVGQPTTEIGRLVETVVCFRTGRIVHAVAQNGLEGTEDIALGVRIATRMYELVRTVFADLDLEATAEAEES